MLRHTLRGGLILTDWAYTKGRIYTQVSAYSQEWAYIEEWASYVRDVNTYKVCVQTDKCRGGETPKI